jgi:O-antigen/teichoic acid export membrane protein
LLLSAMSVATLVVDLCDFGTSTFMSRELARNTMTARDVLRFNIRRLPYFSLVIPVWVLGCSLIDDGLPRAVYVLGTYPMVLIASMAANATCRGVGYFGTAAIGSLIERGMLFGCTIIGVSLHADVALWYGLGLIAGSVASSIFCFSRAVGDRHEPRGPQCSLYSVYRRSRHFGLSGLATDLSSLEVPLVAAASGGVTAGQFGAANRVSGPLGVPASAISGALFPAVASQSRHAASRTTLRALLALLPLGIIFLLLGVFASTLVTRVLGTQYGSNTSFALQLILAATWLGSLNQIIYVLFQGTGRQREVARSLVVTMSAGLVFTTVGAYSAGAPGAAAGVVVKEVLTSIWVLILWRRLIQGPQAESESDVQQRELPIVAQ